MSPWLSGGPGAGGPAPDEYRSTFQAEALPGERELLRLASRYEDADRRVRELVARVAEGADRSRALADGAVLYAELRREAPAAAEHLNTAYLVAALATAGMVGRDVAPATADVRDLSGSLVASLTAGLVAAEQGLRAAVRAVTPDEVPKWALEAVTADVDGAGRRRGLGLHASTLARTLGRHASSRGVALGVGDGEQVRVSSHENPNPICPDGKLLVVGRDRMPPFHANCTHFARAEGYTQADFFQASVHVNSREGRQGAAAAP